MTTLSVEEHLYNSFINFKGANLTEDEIEELVLRDLAIRARLVKKAASELNLENIPDNAMDRISGFTWEDFKDNLREKYGEKEVLKD